METFNYSISYIANCEFAGDGVDYFEFDIYPVKNSFDICEGELSTEIDQLAQLLGNDVLYTIIKIPKFFDESQLRTIEYLLNVVDWNFDKLNGELINFCGKCPKKLHWMNTEAYDWFVSFFKEISIN